MKNSKTFKITDIYHNLRPLSWSAISSFEYSPEQWYSSYILGIRQESRELAFGSWVDNQLQIDPTFLPQVERYPVMQHKMVAKLKGVIPLVGLTDGWDPKRKIIADYKTGKKPWDQKRADDTGQLTMYAFLLYLTEGIKPADLKLRIIWLPTKEFGDFSIGFRDEPVVPKIFDTQRTMLDVLEFGARIKYTLNAMEVYAQDRLDNEHAMKV